MQVDATTPENVRFVAERMRDSDFREFSAVSYAKTRQQLADVMVDLYGRHPGGMCAYAAGSPAAVGALIEGRPNVVTLMFFATDAMAGIAIPLTRFIRKSVFPLYRDDGVHRIECISIDGHGEAHRWIEILGLKREAVFQGYGKHGEAFHQFAWVKP